jgi:hypothetical protein
MNMRLIGAPTLKDVVPGMVDTSALNPGQAPDTQFDANCMFTLSPSRIMLMRQTRGWFLSVSRPSCSDTNLVDLVCIVASLAIQRSALVHGVYRVVDERTVPLQVRTW